MNVAQSMGAAAVVGGSFTTAGVLEVVLSDLNAVRGVDYGMAAGVMLQLGHMGLAAVPVIERGALSNVTCSLAILAVATTVADATSLLLVGMPDAVTEDSARHVYVLASAVVAAALIVIVIASSALCGCCMRGCCRCRSSAVVAPIHLGAAKGGQNDGLSYLAYV